MSGSVAVAAAVGYGISAGGTREEVDGGYLLCFDSRISIEVRGNGDWLPIVLELNEKERVFEGSECIEGKRLIVEDK